MRRRRSERNTPSSRRSSASAVRAVSATSAIACPARSGCVANTACAAFGLHRDDAHVVRHDVVQVACDRETLPRRGAAAHRPPAALAIHAARSRWVRIVSPTTQAVIPAK